MNSIRKSSTAAFALFVAGAGSVAGIAAGWFFSGSYTDYRALPTVFFPPEDFSPFSAYSLWHGACFSAAAAVVWLLCAFLQNRPQNLARRLQQNALPFSGLFVSSLILVLNYAGVAPGYWVVAVFGAGLVPPTALLLYRLAERLPLTAGRKTAAAVLAVLTALFGVFFAMQTIRQYYALNLGYADSGYVAEALHHTLRGQIFRCNSLPFGNYLGDHFSPILFLLLPIYALIPTHETLLALHAIILGLGAVPVYLLGRHLVRERTDTPGHFVGLALAAAYLLHPAVQFQVFCFSYAFKAATLAIPLLLWAMFFAVSGRKLLFVLFGVLTLACEESLVSVVLGFGVYVAIARKMKLGWLMAGVAVGWWFAATEVIMPAIRGGGESKQFATFYSWMGETPAEAAAFMASHPLQVARRFFSRDVAVFLAEMLLPAGLLCLAVPEVLLVGALTFLFLVLSSQTAFLSIYFQYKAGLLPVLFFATALGLARLADWRKIREWCEVDNRRAARFLGCVAAASAGIACYLIGPTPLSHNYAPGLYKAEAYDAVQELRQIIPPDAALLATERVAAHFTHQRLLHRLGWKPEADYDYVLLDLNDRWGNRPLIFETRKMYLARPEYAPVYARDGFVLFKRNGKKPAELQPLGPVDAPIAEKLAGRAQFAVGEDAEIARIQFGRPPDDVNRANATAIIYWRCLRDMQTDRACIVTVTKQSAEGEQTYTRVFRPCRGIFPTSFWRPGMIIADRYDMQLPFELNGMVRIDFKWKKD